MILREALAHTIVAASMSTLGRSAYRRLLKAADEPRQAQQRALTAILGALAPTEYGQQYGFARLRNADEFRRAVPIQDYEALRQYIDRQIETGRPVVTAEPPIMYARTSGTTGKPKLIPVTADSMRRVKAAQRAMAYVQHRSLGAFRGRVLALAGALREDSLPDGTPIGAATGLIYRTMSGLIRAKYVLPTEVFEIEDYELRYAVMARLAAQHADISVIATANPSSILRLMHEIESSLPQIVEDLADGGSRLAAKLPAHLRAPIAAAFVADRRRAIDLQAKLERGGRLTIGDVWPNLCSVMTWLGGGCAVAAQAVQELLPHSARMVDAGYVASEVRGTIVVDVARNLALPMLEDVFFEFVPVGEWSAGQRETRLLHELADGEAYYLFISTPAGLARYHMNDIVRVSGRVGATPALAFVRKGRGVTNITGEKLSEDQVNLAFADGLARAGIRAPFYVLVADAEISGYRGYVELGEQHHALAASIGTELDQALRALNIEYDSKRGSGRLKPLQLFALAAGAERAYRRHCVAKGQREAQFKVLTLQDAGEFDFDVAPFLIRVTTACACV
jgi:hypothetical protein